MTDREAAALSDRLQKIERLAGRAAANVEAMMAHRDVGDAAAAEQYRKSLAQRCAAILEYADCLREMVPDAGRFTLDTSSKTGGNHGT